MTQQEAVIIGDASAAVSGALAPRLRLGIGVTGHRLERLGPENVAAVTTAIDSLLGEIERAAPRLDRADLRLITGFADGADSIAADAAMNRGWSIDAVLPFPREDYARDFADEAERTVYARRLEACAAVMELAGDRATDDRGGAAYERAGRVVLAQCDILVAVWDGAPARGRGGAAEVVADAVLRGIPVIHLDIAGTTPPALLWDGLAELDLGEQTVETVARGDLSALPRLVGELLDPPADAGSRDMLRRFGTAVHRRWTVAIAYPLLLAVIGVRRFRMSDLRHSADLAGAEAAVRDSCTSDEGFAARMLSLLAPRFGRADMIATRSAQRFRSIYVSNFALAALAVVVSLLGLTLSAGAKPILILLELAIIAAILIQTRAGNRAAWHRLWLDNRALAERLRCLALSARLGNLDLRTGDDRTPGWVGWYARATARELGLPSARIDDAYLACVRLDLLTLIDGQVAYLEGDAHRMHRLEHRLHTLGTWLFAATAVACLGVLAFKAANAATHSLEGLSHSVAIAATIIGAALPAVGAAIYGIRMQGDFAGIAARNHALGAHLAALRNVIAADALAFDTLDRRVRRATGLLTEDLEAWLQTYDARPLTLPG